MNSPRLEPNKKKILEALLYLIGLGEEANRPLTQYELVKSIFIGDLCHLQKYGRPITFDNYSALEFGPCPETTYDILKPNYNGASEFGEWPLWLTRPSPKSPKAKVFYGIKRAYNAKRLSLTDVAELKSAYEQVKRLGFGGVVDFTHELPAYKQAWKSRGLKSSNKMDYKLLLSGDSSELVQELTEASKYL